MYLHKYQQEMVAYWKCLIVDGTLFTNDFFFHTNISMAAFLRYPYKDSTTKIVEYLHG